MSMEKGRSIIKLNKAVNTEQLVECLPSMNESLTMYKLGIMIHVLNPGTQERGRS